MWCVSLLCVFATFWVALPSFDLARALLPEVVTAYKLSKGDMAVRILWVCAGPLRSAFMAGLMTSLVLVLQAARPDLKAVRAAAKLGGNEGDMDGGRALSHASALLRR